MKRVSFSPIAALCLAMLAPLLSTPSLADTSRETLTAIHELLDDAYSEHKPGAGIIIQQDGEIVLLTARGLANVELGVANTPDTVFRIGSITKQFTAAGVLLLQERGKLSVDDPITRFLPDYPTNGHTITVRHLLNHTSGIVSYTDIPGYFDGGQIRQTLTTEQLIDVFKELPMNFAPGTEMRYNNSGYVLLGAIIEEVTGQPYAEFIAESITGPLRLERTSYEASAVIPNSASGYSVSENGDVVHAGYVDMTQPFAAGSLISTVGDLADWNTALSGGELISEASYRQMIAPTVLANGEEENYGYGLGIGTVRGEPRVSHSGGIHGFISSAMWLPEQEIYIAILNNSDSQSPGPVTLTTRIAAIMLGDPYTERTPVTLSRDTMEGLVGIYVNDDQPDIEISIVDGGLQVDVGDFFHYEASAESKNLIYQPDTLTFAEVEWSGGIAAALHMYDSEDDEPVIYRRQ